MASNAQTERILAAAITGIPRVAKRIAKTPTEFREQALEAAERSYWQTLRVLGCAEADAQGWISAVMFRLRKQVTEHEATERSGAEAENIVGIRKSG